ncbi:MAG: zinc ABC transporter solute-binding protein, partial [Deltaproteobacteria bacterium]|nr:zinc ABC transporter solute-binding protein [Deltaproteobacteria bacterium]
DDHHNRLDPHIWLSPRLVKVQAKTVLEALQEADPASRSFYQNNYNRFIKLVSDLDGELTDLFRSKRQARFLVFHPSWGYFAKAYGLKQVAIEIEGKTPKPAQLKRIIEQMREYGIRIIFVQPQFSSKAAKLIARAINGEVVFIDPLSEDWMVNMRQVADKFKRTLK